MLDNYLGDFLSHEVKPVEQVLCFGTEVELHIANGVTPIGEKLNLLVHLEALGLKQLEQPVLWLLVVRLDKGKALAGRGGVVFAASERQDALPCDNFKPPLLHTLRLDVPAVNAHGQRPIRGREFAPIARASLNRGPALLAQFLSQSLGQRADVI